MKPSTQEINVFTFRIETDAVIETISVPITNNEVPSYLEYDNRIYKLATWNERNLSALYREIPIKKLEKKVTYTLSS